jgi:hypothetical protein
VCVILKVLRFAPALCTFVRIRHNCASKAPKGSDARVTPQHFVEKWSRVDLPERSASQQHFIALCRMPGQPTPADHDATGAEYTFEKMVDVTEGASASAKGDRGFADVWWRMLLDGSKIG